MILSHIKRISKNSFWFALGTILTQAMGFFLLPLYTRFLTPADYGIISIADCHLIYTLYYLYVWDERCNW